MSGKGTPTITQQELDRCVAEQQQKYRDLFAIHCSLARQRDTLVAEVEKQKAGWGEAFRLAVYHQDRADKAEAHRDALVTAAEHAREVLSTLYAKYGAAIGPYSSQAQQCNVELGAALKAARGGS